MFSRFIIRNFRVRTHKNKPFITELEKIEYEKLVKGYRKHNTDLYWEIQTKVENDFISKIMRQS